jgi:anaerobic selenocysteine-containing dehydrogenase
LSKFKINLKEKRKMQRKDAPGGGNSGQPEAGGEKSFLKGLGLNDFGSNGNISVVDVKAGKIVRIRPLHFDSKYSQEKFNSWKMEVQGQLLEPGMKTLIAHFDLGYKKRVYSPNRVLYPLKRIDWDPNGQRNSQNRGTSKYVRISWDEALAIVVNEIKRIRKQYGPEAILAQADGHGEGKVIHTAHGSAVKFLDMLGGGYTLQIRNPDSWEGWYWGAKHVWNMPGPGQMSPSSNLIPDIAENAKQVLFWGCDPETTPLGFNGQMASRICYWWTQLGIKSVYICPEVNYGAAVHADKWIPILPSTDAALHLAIAYIWISEGTYDNDYVSTHAYGFDKFAEYVMGKEDGVPKTPAWAAGKTAIPEWTIKALAREWASKTTSIAHGNGGPGMRGPYASENGRLEVLLLAMQGLGKPGVHEVKMIEWAPHPDYGYKQGPMPAGVTMINLRGPAFGVLRAGSGSWDYPQAGGAPEKPRRPKQFIPKDLIHDALLHAPISWYGNSSFNAPIEDQFIKYTYPAEGCSEVHMIWTDTPCWITCWNDSNRYIEGLRSPKVEFILAQHPWLENDCLFADLILPVSTKFEEDDIGADQSNGQFYTAVHEKRCIEPLGESKSDYEIVSLIAEKFGLLDKYQGGKTIEEWLRFYFANSGLKDMITYEEFAEKGYFVVPTDPDWKKSPAGLLKFYQDPRKNPLQTPSGKLEFFAQTLAKHFPDDPERPPVPHWIEKGESHDERISSTRTGKYPLLLMSNHGRWRVHAQCDDITWTREVATCKVNGPDGYKYEPLWINPRDARARGVKYGDVVKIFNERGAVLGGAYVTERVMPGVVYMDHGARYDPIVPGELDRGGAINTITPHNTTSKNATGMAASSFLVEVAGADLPALRKKYPEAFARPYSPDAGLCLERALE